MKITCIICPKGCQIDVDAEAKTVCGNGCPRGKEYALGECLHPCRTVTSVLPVENRPDVYLPVKTAKPVPKDKIFALTELIHAKKAVAPVSIGDIIIKDVFGTDLIAAKTIK